MLGIGYHIPAVAHPDHPAVEILDWILGDKPSGRLYQSLVRERKASTIFSRIEAGHDPGMLLCFGQVEDGVDVQEFGELMTAAIEQVVQQGVSEEEADRAVADILKDMEDQANDPEQFTMTLSDWAAWGDWRLFYLHRDRLARVTPGDVQHVAEKYLKRSNRTVGIFTPVAEPDRTRIPSTPRVADLVRDYRGREAVARGEVFEPTPENIARRVQRGRLSSGVTCALLPKQSRGDRFYLQLTLRYGTADALNQPETLMACQLLPLMFNKGTSSRTRQQIEDETTALKCDINISGNRGYVTFNVQGRQQHLAATLDLLTDMLRQPAFPAEELELLKAEQIAQIESQKSSPQLQALLTLSRKLKPVGPDSIYYAPDADEQIERIGMVTVQSLRYLHDEFLSGSHGELTAVGSLDPDVVRQKMEAALTGWQSKQTFQRIPEAFFETQPESIAIETPDKANAIALIAANLAVRSDDPDWEALYIANDILGGGSLASRLGQRVREEKGLSYTVMSQFQAEALDRSGSFTAFAITNPANRDALLNTIDQVFDEFLENGVTEQELAAAKTSYARSIEDILGSDLQLTGVLHNYQHYGRDESFLRERLNRMAGLTVDEVNSAAAKLLNNREFITVTAGDFANARSEDAIREDD
jgi:zinc protease